MEEKADLRPCSQTGCPHGTTGICMENNGKECQYLNGFVKEEVVPAPVETSVIEAELYHLSGNREIEEKHTSRITHDFPCNLVVLVGDPECGKSTLYAALYDKFQKGPCAGYLFAGSKTPIAFERRCHHARLISLNKKSKNERTYSREFAYLHLSVRLETLDEPARHIMFADVNGEKYQNARNQDDEMLSLGVFHRANLICFIADGDLLIDPAKKNAAKANLLKLIGRAVQNNMINTAKGITILITKWDVVEANEKVEEINNFINVSLKKRFPDLVKQTLYIASRSQNSRIPAGTGIESFLDLCLKKSCAQAYDYSDIVLTLDSLRQSQKFKYRTDGSN